MKENMVLIMIDECGDEAEIDRYALQLGLGEDEVELWKVRKIDRAAEQFPEARGFYFEDRRHWDAMIARAITEAEGWNPGEDEDEEWEE